MRLTEVKDRRRAADRQVFMWTYHQDLLARPVPRYTSFPTAAEFTGVVGAAEYEAALRTVPPGADVSLYVHIPFCEQICWYCGCNTGRANRRQRLTSYLAALSAEIGMIGERLREKQVKVSRISFGGGSPNAIRPYEFARLLYELALAFPGGEPVISTELDPRSFSDEWGAVFRRGHISHASLGVQTFSPRLQAAIGRVQDRALIERCTETLRDSGIISLNFDLMYGLPGQTVDDLSETLDTAVALSPDRIALFGYAHVPDLLPRQRQIDASALPGAAERFRMAEAGWLALTAAGYVQVGFDHFAKPDDGLAQAAAGGNLRRNFQGFTDDPAEYLIGFGASAISQFPGVIVQNEKNAGRYRMRISAGQPAAGRGVTRSEDDQWRAAIIEDLLCCGRADIGVLPDPRPELERLAPFARRGLVSLDGLQLRLAPSALPYARSIAAAFDPYRVPEGRRFSSAV